MTQKIILKLAKSNDNQQPGYIKRILTPFQPKEEKIPVILRLKSGPKLGRAMLVKRQKPEYLAWLAGKKSKNIPSY